MNIDVTVVRDCEMWSEKFNGVAAVQEVDSGTLVVTSPGARTEEVERDGVKYIVVRGGGEKDIASFAPGSWHSWRQMKD